VNNIDRNRLKEGLGIKQNEDPLAAFEKNPSTSTLSRIGKRMQTPEMVRRAIENDSKPILKNVSKKLLTPELCLLALKKNGSGIQLCTNRMARSIYVYSCCE
jgi:hypothetical protein